MGPDAGMSPAALPTRPNRRRRPGYRARAAAAAAALFALAACGYWRGGGQVGPDVQGRPAALASLVVVNRTARALDIGYRPAAEAGGVVIVGRVPPHAKAEMAPVPAEEPLLLFARAEHGTAWLPPRVLEIDEEWTWVIDDSTSFQPQP